MVRMLALAFASLLFAPGLSIRHRRQRKGATEVSTTWAYCSWIGCSAPYNHSRPCQCNDDCSGLGNCCPDYQELCEGGPAPAPGPGPPASDDATYYWRNTNLSNAADMQSRLRSTAKKLSYRDLWGAFTRMWKDLPGKCQGRIYDVYSSKCWYAGGSQCGQYRREGDCYNREHSWPKSWWGRDENSAYSDVFSVMPSDGYVNGRRGSFPFGEVSSPTYTSGEGNKVGPCRTSGYSGTCFEPTDRSKGLLARAHLYMAVRYKNEFGCCSNDAVDGADMKAWTARLMLQWHKAHPPQDWEIEFNDRAQREQRNRNPFIDFPQYAQSIFG